MTPIDPGQFARLTMGGTVALPPPFPTIGVVSADTVSQGGDLGDTLIHIVHEKKPQEAAIWSVRARDVAAFEQKDVVDPDPCEGDKEPVWYRGYQQVLNALEIPQKGILYVLNEAQVLLRLEYGTTAIDSVDIALEPGLGATCKCPKKPPCGSGVQCKCPKKPPTC